MKIWQMQAAVSAAVIFWLAWAFQQPILRHIWPSGWVPEQLGQWGDTFGALNALFAGSAFIAVLRTLFLQQEQIREQRVELERQRQIQDAAETRRLVEVEDVRRRDHLQKFEDTFFQLLSLFRELRNEVSIRPSGQYGTSLMNTSEQHGHLAFQYAAGLLEYWARKHAYPDTSTRQGLVLLYETEVHKDNEDELGPYFRVCYTILRRVSEDPILSEQEKASYGNLVRSQLSSAELKVISFNALTPAANNFNEFIEEFHILKYLGKETITRGLVEDHYDPSAFESRD